MKIESKHKIILVDFFETIVYRDICREEFYFKWAGKVRSTFGLDTDILSIKKIRVEAALFFDQHKLLLYTFADVCSQIYRRLGLLTNWELPSIQKFTVMLTELEYALYSVYMRCVV